MTRKKKILISGLSLGLLILMALGYFYLQFLKLDKSKVDFVERPDLNQSEQEKLDEIEGTPKDLDEDYYYIDDEGNEAIFKRVPIDEEVFNVLFLGSDVRPTEEGNGRSDSMMLISYNGKENSLKITSFLRDTWVSIPGREWNRINAAFAFGGIGLAVNTVNENFDLDIQNYAIVEFDGLKEIVDEMGGIELNLTLKEIKKLNSAHPENPFPLTEGRYLLNGEQTLTHARNRRTGDGDFGRARRQRDVLLSMLGKMKSSLTPTKLPGFVSKTLKHMDTNIAPNTVFSLGMQLIGSGGYTVETAKVLFDDTWSYANKDGRSVVTINLEENVELLHEFLYDHLDKTIEEENE